MYSSVLAGLPLELPWALGSQQACSGEAWYGLWRCVGCRGAKRPWSSLSSPCALGPGDCQTPAGHGARPVTSWPVEGGNSGGACRGHDGLGEHWRPQPTQGQRQEGGVKQARQKNMLVCMCKASGMCLSQWATWGIVVEYNMMIEREGRQKFFHWEYVIVLWMRVKDAFMFQGGYAILKTGAKHQHCAVLLPLSDLNCPD